MLATRSQTYAAVFQQACQATFAGYQVGSVTLEAIANKDIQPLAQSTAARNTTKLEGVMRRCHNPDLFRLG